MVRHRSWLLTLALGGVAVRGLVITNREHVSFLSRTDDECRHFAIPPSSNFSGRGKLFEYYHFLIDFAAPISYYLREVNATCIRIHVPDWLKDEKFLLSPSNFHEMTMQPHFDYLFQGRDIELAPVASRDEMLAHSKWTELPWTLNASHEEWSNQSSKTFHYFRRYAWELANVGPDSANDGDDMVDMDTENSGEGSSDIQPNMDTPSGQRVVVIRRAMLVHGCSHPQRSGWCRRHLNMEFYTGLKHDLHQRGIEVEIVELEHATLEDQIKTFSNATVILGQHGAGLSNIVFARPGTLVIEVGDRLKLCFETLSQKLGLPYASFLQALDYSQDMGDAISEKIMHDRMTNVSNMLARVLNGTAPMGFFHHR